MERREEGVVREWVISDSRTRPLLLRDATGGSLLPRVAAPGAAVSLLRLVSRLDKLLYVGVNEDRSSQLQVLHAILRK